MEIIRRSDNSTWEGDKDSPSLFSSFVAGKVTTAGGKSTKRQHYPPGKMRRSFPEKVPLGGFLPSARLGLPSVPFLAEQSRIRTNGGETMLEK